MDGLMYMTDRTRVRAIRDGRDMGKPLPWYNRFQVDGMTREQRERLEEARCLLELRGVANWFDITLVVCDE